MFLGLSVRTFLCAIQQNIILFLLATDDDDDPVSFVRLGGWLVEVGVLENVRFLDIPNKPSRL